MSWIANVSLFAFSCYLFSNIVNQVFAAALAPPPADASVAAAPPPLPRRGWAERRQIIERNLFDSATLAPPVPEVGEEEILEATKLPLKLLGTAAASDPAHSWAAIEDLEARDTVIVRVEDELKHGAAVIRIERRRVVLDENGSPRELALGGEEGEGSPAGARRGPAGAGPARSRPARRAAAPRRVPTPPTETRRLDADRVELPREQVDAALSNPGTLLEQARFFPRYQDGQITGLQVSDPKPGSLIEQAGIQNGEVITEVNGVRIQSPEESRAVLEALSQSSEITVTVEGPEGVRTRTISAPRE